LHRANRGKIVKPNLSKEKNLINFRKAALFSFYILIFIVGALFYMWPHHQMIEISYEYQELIAKHEKLFQENRILRLEIASIKSLDRIERLAVEDLGFIFPKKEQILFLKDKD